MIFSTVLISRSSSYISPSPVRDTVAAGNNHLSDQAIEKQSELSAKAKAVFEESLRQYESKQLGVKDAPPLPPKTDRPPLPPKQRSGRSRADDSSHSSDDQTYVNSAELARQNQRNRTRLSVGNSPLTISTARHRAQADKESSEFVYGNYYSGGQNKVSVPVRATPDKTVNPPSLPPKELRETSDNKNLIKRKGVSTTRIIGTNSKPPMKSVETQTDENEFYFMYDEDGYNHTDSEYSPESNRSASPASPDFSSPKPPPASSYYTRVTAQPAETNVSTPEHYYLGGSGYTGHNAGHMFERPVSASPAAGQLARQAGRRKLEPVQSVPVQRNHHTDPVISGEINWSVSQLRSLFNQGLQGERKQLSAAEQSYLANNDNMAAYHRDSPAHKQFMDRRINYPDTLAGLSSNYVTMYSPDNNHTDSDQESYV